MENNAIEGDKKYKRFSEKSFFEKIIYMLKSIGGTVVYPNLLLFHLFKSSAVGFKQKMMVVGAFAYFILPIDLIPDFLFGFGYTDDIVALVAALTALLTCFNDDVQSAAKGTLNRVLGEYDDRAIEAISKIIQSANRAVNFKNPVVRQEPPTQQAEEKKIEIVDVEEVKPIEAKKG